MSLLGVGSLRIGPHCSSLAEFLKRTREAFPEFHPPPAPKTMGGFYITTVIYPEIWGVNFRADVQLLQRPPSEFIARLPARSEVDRSPDIYLCDEKETMIYHWSGTEEGPRFCVFNVCLLDLNPWLGGWDTPP